VQRLFPRQRERHSRRRGVVLIEYSEFSRNGTGDGKNAQHVPQRIRDALYAAIQLLSSRPQRSHRQEPGAGESYSLQPHHGRERHHDWQCWLRYELRNQSAQNGLSFIIGNLIQKGPNAENSTIISYGEESFFAPGFNNGRAELYVVNNTIVNDRGAGTFIFVMNGIGTTGQIVNNIFSGNGTVLSGTNTMTLTTNLVSNTPGLVNSANYDYRLAPGSPAIDAGSNPGTGAGVSLVPTSQYCIPPTGRTDPSQARLISEPTSFSNRSTDPRAISGPNRLASASAGHASRPGCPGMRPSPRHPGKSAARVTWIVMWSSAPTNARVQTPLRGRSCGNPETGAVGDVGLTSSSGALCTIQSSVTDPPLTVFSGTIRSARAFAPHRQYAPVPSAGRGALRT